MNGWDRARLARAGVLGAWAFVFWFLTLTGRTSLYLSSRTAWLVPLGAALTTVGCIGGVLSARGRSVRSNPPRLRAALVVLPVAVLIVMPRVTLGTFAVARRSSVGGVSGVITPDDFEHGPLTMIHIAAAQTSQEDMDRLRARAGEQVQFTGFITRDADSPADEFVLTRFIITCCVADAMPAQVHVVAAPPGIGADGDWVDVTGRIYPLGDEIVLAASSALPVPTPASPYLTAYP